LAVVPSALEASPPEGTHVRARDKRLVAALADGNARSARFRDLVARVERSNVIAYIELQPRLRGKLAGTTTWVVATREFRYVRVELNPELTGANLAATLAHELQHVVEIGEAASVVDEASFSSHYREVGIGSRARLDRWDTEAAQLAGEIVRRELAGEALDPAPLLARSLTPGSLGRF
jgi:hypothetical protein